MLLPLGVRLLPRRAEPRSALGDKAGAADLAGGGDSTLVGDWRVILPTRDGEDASRLRAAGDELLVSPEPCEDISQQNLLKRSYEQFVST